MRHTLAVLVENKPGVLARIAGLFNRRHFNIQSLSVGETEKPEISRMTIVVEGDDATIEQVKKQLNKLINVLKVTDLTWEETVERELVLIKVQADPTQRAEIMQIATTFRGNVVDVGQRSLTIEITGDSGKTSALEELLRPFGIVELMRTGQITMARGPKALIKQIEQDEKAASC